MAKKTTKKKNAKASQKVQKKSPAKASAKVSKKAVTAAPKAPKVKPAKAKPVQAKKEEVMHTPAATASVPSLSANLGSVSGPFSGPDAAAAAEGKGVSAMQALKSFRSNPDVENFYRFIYENDLRIEALQILDLSIEEKRNLKRLKQAKSSQIH